MSDQLLRSFKGDIRAPLPLHPLEKALLWIAALNVCSLPWMLGGMRPWAQFTSLGLSSVALILALIPRHYRDEYARQSDYTLHLWRKLVRWPLFWIGGVFFGYVMIQALNPGYEFVQKETSWSMHKIDHIEWLPTGMRTPFEMMNTWRQMMIWGAPFLLACALWTGFTRRKSVINLLTIIVINATVLAIVGIAARETAPNKILWLLDGQKNYCFASFVYKNHAGAFFALMVGFSIVVAVWHHTRAYRLQQRSNPAGLFLLLATVQSTAILLTYSRAAIIITAGFLIVTTFISGIQLLNRGRPSRASFYLAILCIGFIAFSGMAAKLINSDQKIDRIMDLAEGDHSDRSVITRKIAWQAGYDMGMEKPIAGWGAGGFRFLFPRYQTAYPEISYIGQGERRRFTFWENAHNDYLQLWIEMGYIGVGIILLGSVYLALYFIRVGGAKSTTAKSMAGAIILPLSHALTDFPLQNPAILVSLAVLVSSSIFNLDGKPSGSATRLFH